MTERVILIKGDATKWYNQAIFIVNQNTPATKMPVDFVEEAEKIIYGYMAKQKSQATLKKAAAPAAYTAQTSKSAAARAARKKKTTTLDFVLNTLMVLACIAIVAIFAYGILS